MTSEDSVTLDDDDAPETDPSWHRNLLGPKLAGLFIVVDAAPPPEALAMQEEVGLRQHRLLLRLDA